MQALYVLDTNLLVVFLCLACVYFVGLAKFTFPVVMDIVYYCVNY